MAVNWCSVLKAYADSQKCTVEYHDLSPMGMMGHDPTFNFKVKLLCNDRPEEQAEATGTGKTKKEAKAQAAQAWMARFGTLQVSGFLVHTVYLI